MPEQSEERRRELLENAGGLLKRAVAEFRRENADAGYTTFFPLTETAVDRAGRLDGAPSDRWPPGLGTRVYRLVGQVLNLHRAEVS